ncbi:MAG: hypothetical protein GOU97_04685 [Nanoarchaeota archaeon]|nr:hypothetical protein [Nanoarchaeota archaeon]
MKKILLVPCGIGLGHATRTHSIINELDGKAEVKIATYGTSYNYFVNNGFKPIKMQGVKFSINDYTFNLFSSLINNWDFPITILENMLLFNKIIKNFDPDIILSDSEPNAVILSKLLKKKCAVITNIPTIPYELKYLPDTIMNELSNHAYVIKKIIDYLIKEADKILVPSLTKYSNKLPHNVQIIDLFVRKKPSELPSQEQIKEMLRIKEDFTLILLSGWGKIQESFLKSLIKTLKGREGKFIAVGSSSVTKPTKMGNVTVLPFTKKVLHYLKACDNVITMAGHSYLSEILVYEKPALVIPIRKHIEQITNASALKRARLAEILVPGNLFEIKLKKKLDMFFESKEELRKRVKRANFKGDGAKQTVQEILKM